MMIRYAGKFLVIALIGILIGMMLVQVGGFAYAAAGRQAAVAGDVNEPNDRFGDATPIAVNGQVEGAISTPGDADWYWILVDQQGELQLALTNVAADLDIDVRLWNANKDTISNWIAPLARGGDTTGSVDLPAAGRYMLEVVDGGGDASSQQSYRLQLSFTPTVDVGEPNNWYGQATPLTIGQGLGANILPQGDADWYTFVVNQQGELQLAITNVASNLDLNVRIWNANKDTISNWITALAKGGDTQGFVDLPEPGRYYLEVIDGSSDARSSQPYKLLATFVPAADAYEPNNSFGMAKNPGSLGATFPANILPQGDADWYSIDVDQHGELDLLISHVPPDLDMNVRVWNANKDTISNWVTPLARGGDTSGFVDLPAPGRYLLEVVDGGADARSSQPFSVTLTYTRAVDPFEPNNSFGAASELGVDRAVQTNILPQGDSDWHYLDVGHQGELQISASAVPPNLEINARVWNANKDTISNWFAPLASGGDTTGVVDLPTPGRYYLEVVDGASDARAIQPFTLSTKFIASADNGEPNNTVDTATPVNLDTTIPANILPANDADWCRLEITTTGELHVLITNVAPELELAMRLWNDEKQAISGWVYPLAPGSNTEGVFPIDKPGIYYLEVVDNRSGRSIQPYLLHFSMQPIDPASVVLTNTVTTTTTILTDTTAITVTKINVTYVITTITGMSGTVTSMQAITTTEVLTLTQESTRTATLDEGVAPTTTLPLTLTTEVSSTAKVIIRTSGQIGPFGGDLFVLGAGIQGVDGARLAVLPDSLAELVTIDLGTSDSPPPGSPFGLFPAGPYWRLTPAGLQFTQPVTITLPLPPGENADRQYFVGHWNGSNWDNLGGAIQNGLISAQTMGFSNFAVFCGQLEKYRTVRFVNDTGNKLVVLRYGAGPAPSPDDPQPDLRGQCPPPSVETGMNEWRFEQSDVQEMRLWPGVYQFVVSYPTPQPGVAITYFVSLAAPGVEGAPAAETIHITPSGLTGEDPATKIVVGGANQAPTIACDALLPAGVAKTIVNPRLIVIGEGVPIKLEQFPPKGEGVLFRVTASDAEGANLRQLWSPYQGALPTVDDSIASGATVSPHYFQFRPTQAGQYDLFVTVYDEFNLFAECRYHVIVAANNRPVIKVFSGRKHVEFGRLDSERLTDNAFAIPSLPVPNPPATPPTPTLPAALSVPSRATLGASVTVTNTLICPTALIGQFEPVTGTDPLAFAVKNPFSKLSYAQIPNAEGILAAPAPVDSLLPPAGNDTTKRWAYPGFTCVWAVIADADGDPLRFRWELPEPIFGKGTVYAALPVPAGYHPDAPNGIAVGTLLQTYEQMNAYNDLLTDLYNLWGVAPSVLWEAWDDPCADGAQNPCESSLSRGGVTNLIGYTTDTFSTPEEQGYTSIAVGAEAFESDCAHVFFIASLTPNPSDPGPSQGVEVTARLSPITENCPIQFQINGTDGYSNQNTIVTNKDGEASFFIPGGAEDVVDVVKALVCVPLNELETEPANVCTTPDLTPGQPIEMNVTYTF